MFPVAAGFILVAWLAIFFNDVAGSSSLSQQM